MREPLSVVVITLNNADTLERCLTAVDWADEIVVLDSGSTDATVDIAKRHGARVAVHPFDDYGPQKQRAIDSASHDWILNLDADEVLSPGTREVIEEALIAPRCRRISAAASRAHVLVGAASEIVAQRTSAAVRPASRAHEQRAGARGGRSRRAGANARKSRFRQRRRRRHRDARRQDQPLFERHGCAQARARTAFRRRAHGRCIRRCSSCASTC